VATRRRAGDREDGAWLSIGALSRATGVAVETLRTWESRYGFPVPERKPSGHRVYPLSAVPRLRRIAQALALGHRAGQVVGASEEALTRLLESTGAGSEPRAHTPSLPPAEDLPGLLRLVKHFEGERLTRTLLGDWGRMGPIEFLEERIAPLIHLVGESWEKEELEVRHEHFLSEKVGDLLRSLRLPFEERATGPLVVFTTLPGEGHGLGLQMAALALTAVGCRTLYLGTEVPLPEVAALAREHGARAVAVSVSTFTRGSAAHAALRRLREMLPRRISLIVGGDGAPRPQPGIEVIQDLARLAEWGRRAQAGLPGRPGDRGAPA